MSYEISELNIKDLETIYDLTVFAGLNAGHSKQEWLKTQHWLLLGSQELTGIESPLGHVMYEGGKIIGYVGYSQRLFKCDGKLFPALVTNDLVVHPNHRGLAGIILCKHTFQCISSGKFPQKIIGLHNSRAATALYLALGAGEVRNSGRTLSAVTSVGNFLSDRLPMLSPVFKGLQILDFFPFVPSFLAKRGKTVVRNGTLRMKNFSSNDFLASNKYGVRELLHAFMNTVDTGVVRDLKYLKWRYADHPTRSFQWYGLLEGEKISALAVAQKTNHRSTNLCELFIGPEKSKESMQDILRATLFACGRDGSGFVRSKVITPQILEAFREIGIGEEEKEYNQFSVFPPPEKIGNPIFSYGDNKVL